MGASRGGHSKVALTLIQHGAGVNLQDEVGMVTCVYNTCFCFARLNFTYVLQIATIYD